MCVCACVRVRARARAPCGCNTIYKSKSKNTCAHISSRILHWLIREPNSAILIDMANTTGVAGRRQFGFEPVRGQLDLEQGVAIVDEGLEVDQPLVVNKHAVDRLECLRTKQTGQDFRQTWLDAV